MRRKNVWLLPTLAMGLTLVVFGLLFAVIVRPLENGADSVDAKNRRSVADHMASARALLSQGNFRLAQADLDAVNEEEHSHRGLHQLVREVGIFADLLAEPLENLLAHAEQIDEKEWQLQFDARYRNKSVILDTEFRKRSTGSIECGYALFGRDRQALLLCDNLEVLRQLNLVRPGRVIIGLRLESIRREPPQLAWVVRFAPDAVLITEAAVGLLCPEFANEDGQQQLELQKQWLP